MEDIILTNTYTIQNAVEDNDRLNIEGYCCHYNTTNLNDQVVDSRSFDYFFGLYNSGKMKPALNYEHTTEIIGGVDSIERRDDGLFMTAHLNKSVPVNNMIIPNILAGDIKSFSTEGFVKGGYSGLVETENGFYIKDFILTAVAIVSVPADWDAEFSVANVLKGYQEWKNSLTEATDQEVEEAVNEVKRSKLILL